MLWRVLASPGRALSGQRFDKVFAVDITAKPTDES